MIFKGFHEDFPKKEKHRFEILGLVRGKEVLLTRQTGDMYVLGIENSRYSIPAVLFKKLDFEY